MFLIAKNLTKTFSVESGFFENASRKIEALKDICFTVDEGEAFGIVGESGCGKTTLARIIARIIKPTSGTIEYGNQVEKPSRDIQMIFQNPEEALNPKMTVRELLLEPLWCNKIQGDLLERIQEAIKVLHLSQSALRRFPHQFSGGQKQKIVIARAIALQPKLLICDEPTSSLDLCAQAHILNLLLELKRKFNLTLLFISHDLNIIKIISDRIMIMYSGIIMELGRKQAICSNPIHPYSQLLITHTGMKKNRFFDTGPQKHGCKYLQYCPLKQKKCENQVPPLLEVSSGHWVRCFNI